MLQYSDFAAVLRRKCCLSLDRVRAMGMSVAGTEKRKRLHLTDLPVVDVLLLVGKTGASFRRHRTKEAR